MIGLYIKPRLVIGLEELKTMVLLVGQIKGNTIHIEEICDWLVHKTTTYDWLGTKNHDM